MSLRQVATIMFAFQMHMVRSMQAEDYPPACPDGICPRLGRAFYLPNYNVIHNNLGRAVALNTKLGECARKVKSTYAHREEKVVDSMQGLVSEVKKELDLKGEVGAATIMTADGSINDHTDYNSNWTASFHATTLDVVSIKLQVFLKQSTECLGDESNFDPGFLKSFKFLPEIDAEKVDESSSWTPYAHFLKQVGSHIMMRQDIGSRFQQWESSTSNNSNIAKSLAAKACAKVEGDLDLGGWSVDSCANYNNSEKRAALKTKSHSDRVILGGSPASRLALLNDVTKQTLSDFISSADDGDEAVSHGFKPIWETLITLYSFLCLENGPSSENCKHQQRAHNLQAAYEGFLATGCPKMTTSNGFVYQRMTISDPNATIKRYQCEVAKTGCNTDDDCHRGGVIGAVCYCYGESCIARGHPVIGTSMQRSRVRGDKGVTPYNYGPNQACHYRIGGGCTCDEKWSGGLGARLLYVQGQTSVLNSRSAPIPTLV